MEANHVAKASGNATKENGTRRNASALATMVATSRPNQPPLIQA